jgi:imidazolonepropionase
MANQPRADLVITHAASLCQIKDTGGPRCGASQADLDMIADGAIAVAGETILAVGPTPEVLAACDSANADVLDASGRTVLPGLVEAHSHPAFAGSRFLEYAQRLSGVPRGEILAAGGGIWNSVLQTRTASDAELLSRTVRAFERMLADGITTTEAKSGYGLTAEQELRCLRIIDEARHQTALEVAPTFLGAHVVPAGLSVDAYVEQICREMLPAVVEQGIAEFCDVSCEAGDFDVRQARKVIECSMRHGYPCRIHADAWEASGAWPLASELHALTADHLSGTSDAEIRAVGRSETIAVLLPTAELTYLMARHANARLLIEQEVPVVIATDYCSSIPAWSLRASIGLASARLGMTPGEAIVGATLNAAYSLQRQNRIGSLEPGKQADILVLACQHPFQLVWELGQTPVQQVIKRGRVVASNQ